MPSSSASLVTAVKRNDKYRFRVDAILSFHVVENNYLATG